LASRKEFLIVLALFRRPKFMQVRCSFQATSVLKL